MPAAKQDQGKRFEQAAQDRAQDAVGLGCRIAVGAILIEPLPGLVAAQTFQPAAQRRANFLRRMIPEIVLNGLQFIHGGLPNYSARPASCGQIERRADAE
jgi:hypothetical protein